MPYPTGYLTLKDIAHLADVSRSAVSNWRARHSDFPCPVNEPATRRPLFRIPEVLHWLREKGLLRDGKSNELVATALVNGLIQVFPDQLQATLAGLTLLADPDRSADLVRQAGASPAQVADLLENSASAAATPGVATLIVDMLLGVGGRGFYSQFGTTQSASSRLLAEAAGTTVTDTVFDPACGIGGTLLALARAHDVAIVGADIAPTAVDVAKLQARLLGVTADFRCRDSLAHAVSSSRQRYRTVVVEAPLNQQADTGHCQNLARSFDENIMVPARAHEAFLLCTLRHLASDGYGYVLTSFSPGVSHQSAELRRLLLRRRQVEAIIQLPEKFLAYSHVNTLLWVLRGSPTAATAVIDASNIPKSKLHVADWLTTLRAGQPLRVPHAVLTPATLLSDHDVLLPRVVMQTLRMMKPDSVITTPQAAEHELTIPAAKVHTTIGRLISEGGLTYSDHKPLTGEYLAVLNDMHAIYPPDVFGQAKYLRIVDPHRFNPQFLAMCINNSRELRQHDFRQATVPLCGLAEQRRIIRSVHSMTRRLLGAGE